MGASWHAGRPVAPSWAVVGAAVIVTASIFLVAPIPAPAAEPTLEARLAALAASYPEQIDRLEDGHLAMRDGTRIVVDDGRAKDHQDKLADADIEDMLSQAYPLARCRGGRPPARNADPGRIRSQAFFMAVYGGTRQAASANMTSVDWFGRQLAFSSVNGAAEALRRVARDLAKLPAQFRKYVKKSSGTFVWRKIAGTPRLSIHSFGAAIDIDASYGDYWRWSGGKPGNVGTYRNRIPSEIVAVFEQHGFIWGGNWYHYDTMHFEYRPELIRIAEMAAGDACPR